MCVSKVTAFYNKYGSRTPLFILNWKFMFSDNITIIVANDTKVCKIRTIGDFFFQLMKVL